jgi:hypothetical protein
MNIFFWSHVPGLLCVYICIQTNRTTLVIISLPKYAQPSAHTLNDTNFPRVNLHALCLPSHFPPSPYCLSASSIFSFNLAPTPHISRPRIHQTKLRPTCHDPWENWYCRVLQHGFVNSISSPHLMGKGKKKRKKKGSYKLTRSRRRWIR